MSNTTQNTNPTEANLLNPITLIGAVFGEIYEQTANIGNAILDAPADFGRGFEENLFTNSNPETPVTAAKPAETSTPKKPTKAQITAEIKRLQAMI